jgi:hypothetical protein
MIGVAPEVDLFKTQPLVSPAKEDVAQAKTHAAVTVKLLKLIVMSSCQNKERSFATRN